MSRLYCWEKKILFCKRQIDLHTVVNASTLPDDPKAMFLNHCTFKALASAHCVEPVRHLCHVLKHPSSITIKTYASLLKK